MATPGALPGSRDWSVLTLRRGPYSATRGTRRLKAVTDRLGHPDVIASGACDVLVDLRVGVLSDAYGVEGVTDDGVVRDGVRGAVAHVDREIGQRHNAPEIHDRARAGYHQVAVVATSKQFRATRRIKRCPTMPFATAATPMSTRRHAVPSLRVPLRSGRKPMDAHRPRRDYGASSRDIPAIR
jgi:hypothetical protein